METPWVEELLRTAEIVHVATLKEDGAPILRPVNFLYEAGKVLELYRYIPPSIYADGIFGVILHPQLFAYAKGYHVGRAHVRLLRSKGIDVHFSRRKGGRIEEGGLACVGLTYQSYPYGHSHHKLNGPNIKGCAEGLA